MEQINNPSFLFVLRVSGIFQSHLRLFSSMRGTTWSQVTSAKLGVFSLFVCLFFVFWVSLSEEGGQGRRGGVHSRSRSFQLCALHYDVCRWSATLCARLRHFLAKDARRRARSAAAPPPPPVCAELRCRRSLALEELPSAAERETPTHRPTDWWRQRRRWRVPTTDGRSGGVQQV